MKMWVICTGLLLLANPAFSASVFRCVDTAGHVTFSQQGCRSDQSSERQQAVNPKPSSDETVRMATTASSTNHGRKVGNDVAVVAERRRVRQQGDRQRAAQRDHQQEHSCGDDTQRRGKRAGPTGKHHKHQRQRPPALSGRQGAGAHGQLR